MPAGNRRSMRTILALLASFAALTVAVAARGDAATAASALPATASGVETLNFYRGLAGLAPVAVNTAWLDGVGAHSRYSVKTGALGHSEDPASPYFSAAGATAAANSNVALGPASMSDRDFTELWLSGPFHAVSMLSPRLAQTAFGSFREATSGAATLDVLRGFDARAASPGSVVTFPASGAALPATLTTVRGGERPDPYTGCPGYAAAGAGQPVYAFFPSAPGLRSASLSVDGVAVESCAYDEASVTDPDPTQLQTKRSILGKDHAVAILPRRPLIVGKTYTATVQTALGAVSWTFAAGDAPPTATTGPVSTTTVTQAPTPTTTTTSPSIQSTTTTATPTSPPTTTTSTSSPTTTTSTSTSSPTSTTSTSSPTTSSSTSTTVGPAPPPPPSPVSGGTSVAGSRYEPISPTRVLDTRSGPGPLGPRPANVELALSLSSIVPANATAVALNVTVVAPADGGYLTVWPTGLGMPYTSNLNYAPEETVPNATIVGLGTGRAVSLWTAAPAHLVVDLFGWFMPAAGPVSTGRYVTVDTARVFDSRLDGSRRPLASGESRPVALSGAGVPADARAVAVNLTVTGGTAPGYLTAWGAGAMPAASNANYRAGETNAAFALVPVTTDASNVPYVNVFADGETHLVVDVVGYITGNGAAAGTSGLFMPENPRRNLDTRGRGPDGFIRGGETTSYDDPRAQPAVGALVTNLTITQPAEAAFATAYPSGTTRPWASNLNAALPGQTRANLAIATTGSGGQVTLYTSASAHLLADVTGWFTR